MALLRPMLARPLSRSIANVPVAAGVYCAGATAVLIVLAGMRGTGAGHASYQDCVVKQRSKWARSYSKRGLINVVL
jgi:hypothetical protein